MIGHNRLPRPPPPHTLLYSMVFSLHRCVHVALRKTAKKSTRNSQILEESGWVESPSLNCSLFLCLDPEHLHVLRRAELGVKTMRETEANTRVWDDFRRNLPSSLYCVSHAKALSLMKMTVSFLGISKHQL